MRVSQLSRPALLGGAPAFEQMVPITQPTLPPYEVLEPGLREVLQDRMVTNGIRVRRFERAIAEALSAKHAVAVASCTSGLLLVWKAMSLEEGEVILPSFTFSATGHALLWNGLTPRFVDIDPHTLLLDPQKVEEAITPRTVGILPVHTFGNPCYPERLETLAQAHGLKLVFDSAHALGAAFDGRMVATFGDAEVFSLSPTKLVVAAEGGLVTTPDDELARRLRIGRDYGNPGNYDCEYAGISARMSEFHALLAIETFQRLPQALEQRERLVSLYYHCLGTLPGLAFQQIVPGARSTYKDFAILVEQGEFGLTRDELATALEAEGVMTRKYFDPPLHRQRAYAAFRAEYEGRLPVTEAVSHKVLCLPLASHYQPETVERICGAIERLYVHRAEVRKALSA